MEKFFKKIMNGTLIVLFLVCLSAVPLIADDISEIRAMTKEKVDAVIRTLKDNSLSKKEKN